MFGVVILAVGAGFFGYRRASTHRTVLQRPLTRLTFDDGLQSEPTWSPDARYVAYSSDRGGKFDIWIQQVSGGNPIQVTKRPGQNWQPDWSPDGKYIAYRSEEGDGGIFVIPALGGAGLERKIAAFGHDPRWSPDSSQVLFKEDGFYIAQLDGSPPREVLAESLAEKKLSARAAAWYPDGKKITVWVADLVAHSHLLDDTDCGWTWNQARNCSRGPEGTCPGFRRQSGRSTVGGVLFLLVTVR